MGVKKIKVLLGFKLSRAEDDADAEKRICVTLKVLGYEPQVVRRSTKKDVQAYLRDNPDCSHAVLMECVGSGVWNQNELAELTDDREISLVVVLTPRRAAEPEYLTTLYAAGITSAVFEQGRKGASAEEVAELLVRPRSRRQARAYYHLGLEGIEIRSLTAEAFNALCVKLTDPALGSCAMARLLAVAEGLNAHQIGDLLKKLPDALREELEGYAEYGQLVSQLREAGVRVSYRRPRRFLTMDDDDSFLEGAKRAVEDAGHDAGAFVERKGQRRHPSPWKGKGSARAKPVTEKAPEVSREGVMEVMERLRFSDGEGDEEGSEEGSLEEITVSLSSKEGGCEGKKTGEGGDGEDDGLFF